MPYSSIHCRCHVRGQSRSFRGNDVFRATLPRHLARVKGSATGARDAMGPGRFTDGVVARQVRTTPDVDGDAAVHVLVIDGKFQRIARDVLAETASRFEPEGSRTFPGMRCLSKAARNPDRLLRCGLACIGTCSAAGSIDSKRMVIRVEQGKGRARIGT